MTTESPFLGVGWAFPPSFSRGGAEVALVGGAEDIEEGLRLLLSTRPGERALRETFGCDLDGLVFEERDQRTVGALRQRVTDAILYHEPRIRLEQVEVVEGRSAASGDAGTLHIQVDYTLRGTNSRYNLVFPFYLDEAVTPGG